MKSNGEAKPFRIGLRLPGSLAARLINASSARKMRRVKPCSQQGIMEEALILWLNRHGEK